MNKTKRTPKQKEPAENHSSDEWNRFKNLTRKLVNTPKSAIDERRKAKP
jgi:hypothetical protein